MLLDGRVERIHVDVQDGARHTVCRYFTVMVIFFDSTGGECGMWFESPNSSCSVCLPGVSVTVVSVCPLPKCTILSLAGSGAD